VGWNVNWTPDESLFSRQVTGEVQFFNPISVPAHTVEKRLKVDGLKSFSLSGGKKVKRITHLYFLFKPLSN
jgi:uncharacterized protein with WD repeat